MTASTDIILVDDDANVLDACRELLEIEGFRVSAHGSVAAALAGLAADSEAVVVSDVRMPRQDGFDLVAAVQAIDREIPIVLMTGHGDIPMALRAMPHANSGRSCASRRSRGYRGPSAVSA